MNGQTREGYARLPEDLLRDLLGGAAEVTEQVKSLLSPALDNRHRLRSTLESLGMLQRFRRTDSRSIAGVDGGYAIERTAAVDLSLSVAVGVEGLSRHSHNWDSTQYEWWTRVSKHDTDADRLARGVMVAQELSILNSAPHEFRILDGSHLTLVIQMNSALTSLSESVRGELRRVWDRLGTISALRTVVSESSIVALPKYDSSREICQKLEIEMDEEIPGDDKYLMGLLLKPGELLRPQRVPTYPWELLHFDARSEKDADLVRQLEDAIRPLKARQIRFTYFKPEDFSPAFRLEIKDAITASDLNALCSTLSSQITGPFVREPYPQYLADVMAKSVGVGLNALQTAAQLALSKSGRPEIAELLVHSYRTEGVSP